MMEAFLHYVWQYKMYADRDMRTSDGRRIQVVHTGFYHQDAGPDFKQAVIKIGEVTWAGDVEIHVKASDWFRHHHHTDDKYKTVILHVVYEKDAEVARSETESYPTLVLKDRIPETVMQDYRKLCYSNQRLPCAFYTEEITTRQWTSWMSGWAIERLTCKQQEILSALHEAHEDWEEVFFRYLARNFGCKTNATAFDLLARSIPYKLIQKHAAARLQIYALIFGQAGMLEQEIDGDDYYASLQDEYRYLKYKYGLTSIGTQTWNLLRLRPSNFPCLRLAQFSELLFRYPRLFRELVDTPDKVLVSYFQQSMPPPYWETHYFFGKAGRRHSARTGDTTIQLIFINVLAPVLFAYGNFSAHAAYCERAVNLWEALPFEENCITKFYRDKGFPAKNACDSQAILALHHQFCQKKKCAECKIGYALLHKSLPHNK